MGALAPGAPMLPMPLLALWNYNQSCSEIALSPSLLNVACFWKSFEGAYVSATLKGHGDKASNEKGGCVSMIFWNNVGGIKLHSDWSVTVSHDHFHLQLLYRKKVCDHLVL